MTDRHELPTNMRRLADAIGLEASLKLYEDYRGELLYIPKNVEDQHRLRGLLTPQQVESLSRKLGGRSLSLPSTLKWGEKKAQICNLLEQGWGVGSIAKSIGCCRGYVYKVQRSVMGGGSTR